MIQTTVFITGCNIVPHFGEAIYAMRQCLLKVINVIAGNDRETSGARGREMKIVCPASVVPDSHQSAAIFYERKWRQLKSHFVPESQALFT